MDVARYTELFLTDSRDQLRRSNALLLEWERLPASTEPVAELFRSFHSLKSSAATMGYAGVAELAHAAENLLESIRRGELAGSRGVVSLLLKAVDVLEVAVADAAAGRAGDSDSMALAEALTRMAGTGSQPVVAVPAPKLERPARPSTRQAARTVRIDPARLDELMTQVGELVISRNRLEVLVASQVGTELEAVTGRIGSLVRGMHAGVLRARLAPLSELFERFPRVVRDLGVELGKSVRLVLEGEGIELDRGMLEDLVDPIVHLLRNAVDHGIELPEVRAGARKPAEGQILIRAERRRDTVVIRVSDDGRGVDREAVRVRAMFEGLLPDDEAPLDDGLLLALIARPGFTLKDRVTTVSGRGVGIDAALIKIRNLGGRMELGTAPGAGTVFTLTFPLTTAIQRVLLVGVAPERYAIPFRHLAEAVRALPGGNSTFSFRGETLPLVDLRSVTGAPGSSGARQRPILVLDLGDRRGALAVDALLGQHDVVVERVEEPADSPRWLSGATILPDGAPALLLDPAALF